MIAGFIDSVKVLSSMAGTAKSAKNEDWVGVGLGSAASAGQIGYTYAKYWGSKETQKLVREGAWILDFAISVLTLEEVVLLNSGVSSGTADPDKYKFGSSAFEAVAANLGQASPTTDEWAGTAADQYSDDNAIAQACAQAMADGDAKLADILKRETTKLSETRQYILDTKLGLIAAIPIALLIYSYIPFGKGLSEIFQIAVALGGLGFANIKFDEQGQASSGHANEVDGVLTDFYKKVTADANSTAQSAV